MDVLSNTYILSRKYYIYWMFEKKINNIICYDKKSNNVVKF